MSESRDLAAFFAEVSEELHGDISEPLTFEKVIKRAVETIPGCDHASITLRGRRGRAATGAATDEPATQADALQYSLEEGPCVDAAFEDTDFVIDDLRSEKRWPQWAPATAGAGLRAALAIRLHSDSETLGALNLYSDTPGAYDDEARTIAMIRVGDDDDAIGNALLVTGCERRWSRGTRFGIAQGVLAVDTTSSSTNARSRCCTGSPTIGTSSSATWPNRSSTSADCPPTSRPEHGSSRSMRREREGYPDDPTTQEEEPCRASPRT